MTSHKPLVIFGGGDFAAIVACLAIDAGYCVACFTGDVPETSDRFSDIAPTLPLAQALVEFPSTNYDAALGFLGKDLQITREAKYHMMREEGYYFPNLVQPGANVTAGALKEGNIIFAGAAVGCRCSIGTGNIVWHNAVLPHDNVVGDFNNIAPTVSLSGYASIDNHCFIGNNSAIGNGVHIGDYGLVGAGAFVKRNLDAHRVIVPHESYVLEGKRSDDFAW